MILFASVVVVKIVGITFYHILHIIPISAHIYWASQGNGNSMVNEVHGIICGGRH